MLGGAISTRRLSRTGILLQEPRECQRVALGPRVYQLATSRLSRIGLMTARGRQTGAVAAGAVAAGAVAAGHTNPMGYKELDQRRRATAYIASRVGHDRTDPHDAGLLLLWTRKKALGVLSRAW